MADKIDDTDKIIQAEQFHDDGTAPVYQVDSFGGIMGNVSAHAGIMKFNLCQDLPIQANSENSNVSYIQKRVVARLVLTPDVLISLSEWLNVIATEMKAEMAAEK